MSKEFLCSVAIALVLGLALPPAAKADLVGWWRFEEGSGEIANDSSGNGHHGKMLGAPKWGSGPEGQGTGSALTFGADKCTVVNCGIFDPTDGTGQCTVALWAFWDGTGTFQHFFTKSNGWGTTTMMLQIELWGAHTDPAYTDRVGVSYDPASVAFSVMPKNEWVHLAWTFDGGNLRLYVNGVDEIGPKPFSIGPNVDAPVLIGASHESEGRIFNGLLDEVRVYSHALSQVEIVSAMKGQAWPYAFGPDPEDGALHPYTWAQLGWRPGDFAVTHDVYLGDNFADVNSGAASTFRGNQGTTSLLIGFAGCPYPDGLIPGTTYYWRIDEVNTADPNSPWKGSVWSFSIPPKTAYNPSPADGAESVALNTKLTWTAGFGAKLHTVYVGADFDTVNNATSGGAMAGTTSYSPTSLKAGQVYYWRVDEMDPPNTYKGQVWSFTTPGAVGKPHPTNGNSDAEMNAVLSWTRSVSAASHQVYFGTDKEAVRKAGTTSPEYKGVKALGAESYDPGLLPWDSTYYWRIDEVNNTNASSPWKGPLWSFRTGKYLLVEDFESYNDIDPPAAGSNRIFDKWIDGYGTTTNGAVVGNNLPPYAERTVIHGGAQSMPYAYDTNLKFSEATLTLASTRNWTAQGVTSLSLWFRGVSTNAAVRMYVSLNGTAVVYHDSPNATQGGGWTPWVIPLQAFADQGVNLANVTSISIGFGTKGSTTTAGGTGKMYFDDIRLYRP